MYLKKAVVLGGGGSRGAYQIGVWKTLQEIGFEYDIVCGTSVGAVNAALMLQGSFECALSLWENINTIKVLDMREGLNFAIPAERNQILQEFLDKFIKGGGVDPAPLEQLLHQVLTEEKVRQSPLDFGLVTVEFPSMRPLVLTKENIPEGQLIDFLMASAACYPAMRSRHIAGKQYIDGGYHSNLPIEIAVEKGAEEIICVDLECIGVIQPNNRKNKRVKYIRCPWDLGPFLIFDPNTARRNIALGELDAKKAFGLYEGKYYAFSRFESEHNRDNFYEHISHHAGLLGLTPNALLEQLLGRSAKKVQRSKTAFVRDMAEGAGRLLDLDPTILYTAHSFNDALFEAAAKYSAQASAAPAGESLPALIERLKAYHRSAIMLYILELLPKSLEQKTWHDALPLLEALMPLDYFAAVYLFVMRG